MGMNCQHSHPCYENESRLIEEYPAMAPAQCAAPKNSEEFFSSLPIPGSADTPENVKKIMISAQPDF
jgi:hypothetical protein